MPYDQLTANVGQEDMAIWWGVQNAVGCHRRAIGLVETAGWRDWYHNVGPTIGYCRSVVVLVAIETLGRKLAGLDTSHGTHTR